MPAAFLRRRLLPQPVSSAVVPRLPLAVGFVIAALLLSAVFLLSMPDDFLWQRVLEDAGHGPVFAGFASVLLWLHAPPAHERVRSTAQYLRVFGIAVAVGLLTELGQSFMPARNVSTHDVLHDAAGATLGLALAWCIERWLARRQGVARGDARPALMLAIILAAVTILAWQPLQCARAYAVRKAAWPTLSPLGEAADAAFGRSHSAQVSYGRLPERYRRLGDGESMRLTFAAGARPAWQVTEPVHDWSGASVLVLDVTNPLPEPAHVMLRIVDATHDWTHADRFNQRLVLPAATRASVRIALPAVALSPRGRRMDMMRVADVMLFATAPLPAGELYLTRVALE